MACIALPLGARSATFIVSNTSPSGPGSLQQAILEANANAGPDIIAFAIGSGAQTIAPTNPLPILTDPVTIDGSTQPGYAGRPLIEISGAGAGGAINGLVIATSNCVIQALAINRFSGDNYSTGDAIQITNGAGSSVVGCYLGIALDGITPAGNAGAGVRIGNPNYYSGPITSSNQIGGPAATARNLIAANGAGVYVLNSPSNSILGNFIGTDLTGSVGVGNTNAGVTLNGYYTTENLVGGTNSSQRNLISGNGNSPYYYSRADGVLLTGCYTNAVFGNFIGVDVTGAFAIPNGEHGVNLQYGYNNLIGGSATGQGNLISGNGVHGVNLGGILADAAYPGTPTPLPTGNVIQGNLIGTDVSGLIALPNQSDGVFIAYNSGNLIGGFLPGEGNLIAFNTNNGVEITGYGSANQNEIAGNVILGNRNLGVLVGYGVNGITILSNSIYANTNLGIDLNGDGVTPNHVGGPLPGYANLDQNYPVLGFPLSYPTQTVISGILNSATNAAFQIELFDNDNPDPSGYGQGQRLLTDLSVTTDTNGNATFTFTNPVALPLTHWITATATDTNGNTSEFSFARQVVDPDSVDIAVTLTGATNPAPKSSPFAYTITVTNNGPANATGVSVTNPLPAGLSFLSATSSQGSCNFSTGTLTCNVGALAAGAGAIITLNVNATLTTNTTDTVSAAANQSDNTLPNNTASLTTSFGIADVAVLMSHTPDPVIAGQPVTYTLIATNLGPDAATGVNLNFQADPSSLITGAAVSQGTYTVGNGYYSVAVNASFGTLPAHASATLTVTDVPTQLAPYAYTMYVSELESDPNYSNNYTNQTPTVLAGPGVIQFTRPLYTITENGGAAVIGVQRTGGTLGTVTVNFATSNLTASAGTDYVATNGTLTFLNGESNKTFTVAILDDGTMDCTEFLLLHLSNPAGGAVLIGQTNATLQIFDDHPAILGLVQGVSLASTNLVTTGNNLSQTPSLSDDGRYVAFASYANNLVTTPDANGTADVFIRDRQSGSNTLVSLDTTGLAAANGFSDYPQISADGREVVFLGIPSNMTTNTATGYTQIFARDLVAGVNVLVSVNINGAQGNSYSDAFSISTNGTKVAFRSAASDLAPGDNNNTYDIYYRDLAASSAVLVSANSSGTGAANGYSDSPRISADGRYVAFGSYANNLSPADNNTRFDIYRRNLALATNELVSANGLGQAGNSSCGSDIFISGDGRYVAFESYDTDLTPGASGSYQEIFLRDMTAGTNQLVSVNSSNQAANAYCILYGMSRDGRYLLFGSYANNLTANDTNNQSNLFVRDVVAGTTTLVTVNLGGTAPANGSFVNASLSSNGRYVIFNSASTDLVAAGKVAGVTDVFVRDLLVGTTTLLSTTLGGVTGGNGNGTDLAISPNGVAAFTSYATDLVQADDNFNGDVFARTPAESAPELVSQGIGVTGNANATDQRITGDGTKVAFVSNAGNLVANDTNNSSDVFLYDLNARAMALISANAANNGTQAGNSDSPRPSANGRFVAYHNATSVPLLAKAQPIMFGSAYDQIYLRDAVSNVTTLVSVNRTNTAPGNGNSINPQITPDGQYVVFESVASDLVSNDVNGATSDVFIRNRTNALCELVSVNAAGTGSANSDSRAPSVSSDGRFVSFETFASNLGPADSNNHFDVYVRDRQTGSNILCSPNLSGNNGGNNDSFGSLVSASGNKVIFFSYASDLAAGDTNGNGDLFAFDIPTRTLQLVSKNINGIPGNGSAFEPAVSADGRYVAFYSDSSDLVPNDNNQNGDVFVRDLLAGTTTLVSVNCQGTGSGNGYSDLPQISADGRYVTFHSYATDLVPGNFSNNSGSVFRRDLQAGITVLVSQNRALTGEGNANSFAPTVSDNGAVVSFLSSASDLIFGDANSADDVFAWTTGVSGIDLAITKSASAASVAQGGALSYTLTVTNYGLTTATSVVVTDALPAALTFVSASASQGTFSHTGGLVSFNLGSLSVGAGAVLSVNTTATVAGSVTNTAFTSAPQTDFNPGNNHASAVVLVTGGAAPALSIASINGNQLFLTWPYPASGYGLETTTNLLPLTVWSPVANAVLNNGLVNYLYLNVNPSETARFFRLRHP